MTSPSGLWAEGDSLSPTNLNKRNPAGNFPAKTYHVAWATGTGTTQISNAITNALAGGYDTVFIDASRLPYDANAVSFNNSIHMVAEGGPTNLDEWDVEAYGADHTGGDSIAAIQAAVNAAAAGDGKIVSLRGTYTVSQPIIAKSFIVFRGQGTANFAATGGTTIRGTFAGGPIILVSDTATVLGLGTSLVSGAGNSFTDTGNATSTYWFNLSYLNTCELNGLSQLCVECYIKTNRTSSNILSSNGALLGTSATGFSSQCFALQVDFAGRLSGLLKTSNGTSSTINSGATLINDNVLHHVAITYDGTTLRLFVDGTQVGSTALTGTVAQDFYEQLTIGPMIGRVPEQTLVVNSAVPIDAVRVRDVATYTGAFTPTFAKWGAADANTLAQCNFDATVGSAIKVTNKNGTAWIPQTISTGAGGAVEVGFEGITLSSLVDGRCMGIYLYGQSYHWHAEEFSTRGCRYGIYGPGGGNHYTWKLDHIYLQSSNQMKYGLAFNATSGIGVLNGGWIEGAECAFLLAGFNVTLNNLFVQVLPGNGIHGGVIRNENNGGAPVVLNSVVVNMETGVSSRWNGTLVLGGLGGLSQAAIVANGCNFEANTKPWITADALEGSIFNSCCFPLVSGNPSSVVTNAGLGAMVRPIIINNCSQTSTWRKWSDVSGAAIVGRIGPYFSASTGSTLNFDASAADEWDITLTSDVTQSSWSKINYGQPVSGAIKMDSTGSRLFTWPTNSKGTVALSVASAAINTFQGFYDGVNVILTSVRTGL